MPTRQEVWADAIARRNQGPSTAFGNRSVSNAGARTSAGDIAPVSLSSAVINELNNKAAESPASSVLPTLTVSSMANRNALKDAGVNTVHRNDLRDMNNETAGKYDLYANTFALPTNTAAEVASGLLEPLAIVGNGIDDFYTGAGNGIDAALDAVIGDGLLGTALGWNGLADQYKNALSGDMIGAGLDIATDMAAIGLTGGAATPLVLGKSLARNAQPIYDAINGVDSVTGRQLSDTQRAVKTGLSGLDIALSAIPGGGMLKSASKGAKNAAKAAEMGEKAESLKGVRNLIGSDKAADDILEMDARQIDDIAERLGEYGIDIDSRTLPEIAAERANKAYDDVVDKVGQLEMDRNPITIDMGKYSDDARNLVMEDAARANPISESIVNIPTGGYDNWRMPGVGGLSNDEAADAFSSYLKTLDENDPLLQKIYKTSQGVTTSEGTSAPQNVDEAIALIGKNKGMWDEANQRKANKSLDDLVLGDIYKRWALDARELPIRNARAQAARDAALQNFDAEKAAQQALLESQKASQDAAVEAARQAAEAKRAQYLKKTKPNKKDRAKQLEEDKDLLFNAIADIGKDSDAYKALSKDIDRAEKSQRYNSIEERGLGRLFKNLRDQEWRDNYFTAASAEPPFHIGGKRELTDAQQEAIESAVDNLSRLKEQGALNMAEAGRSPREIRKFEKGIDKRIKAVEKGADIRAAERQSAQEATGLTNEDKLQRQMEELATFMDDNGLSLAKPAALKKALKKEGAPKVDDVLKMILPESEKSGIVSNAANGALTFFTPMASNYAQGDYDNFPQAGLDMLQDFNLGDAALLALSSPVLRRANRRFGRQTQMSPRDRKITEALLGANLGMRYGAQGGGTMSTALPYDTDATPEDMYLSAINYLTTADRPTVGMPY